jgi:hypothetical protein
MKAERVHFPPRAERSIKDKLNRDRRIKGRSAKCKHNQSFQFTHLRICLRFDEAVEGDVLVDLDAEEERGLEQDALQVPDADVIDGARAELSVELFRPEAAEVVNVEGPEVEDVVAGEAVAFLDDDDARAKQLGLDGRAEAAGAGADYYDALARAYSTTFINLQESVL